MPMWPIIAMIAGSLMQVAGSSQSARAVRREQEAMDDILRQQSLEAEKKAMDNASKYDTDARKLEQAEIQDQILQDISEPAMGALATSQENSKAQGDVSSDYVSAKQASNLRQADIAKNLTRLMSSQMGAHHLRQREGFRMNDTASELNRISRIAQSNARIGQEKIQNASTKGSGLSALGQLVSLGGSAAGMMGPNAFAGLFGSGAGGGAGLGAVPSLGADLGSHFMGTGTTGFTGTGSVGFRPF